MGLTGGQVDRIDAILGPAGLLAERLAGYRHRPQQQAMAEAVAAALAAGATLICEAGTGTGKTFAYLVPALLSGRKVLVSTGTRNLQDQLFQRDLPLVREVLEVPVRIAMLKGRGNYLCRYRLDAALEDHRHRSAGLRRQLLMVREWATVTASGDVAELDLPEDAPVWPAVTSNSDNCLGQGCPEWGRCHLVEARRRAQGAELVVVNHHLLCADLSLRDEGFGEVLPGADCFIVDEAHQLPEVATSFFGTVVSGRQLLDLTRDLELAYQREAGDVPELLDRAAELRRGVLDLRLCLGEEPRRGPWRELAENPDTVRALEEARARLRDLRTALAALQGRGKGLDSCLARGAELDQRLTLLVEGGEAEDIRWYETQGRGFRLHQTPLQVADIFQSQRERRPAAWVFTSATLAVGEGFEHFARRLGIEDARTERWESPFDYNRQALWFVPRGMPDPGTDAYDAAVAELAAPIIEYSRGRAFLLFTSHRALRAAARALEPRVTYPLLVQGSAPRAELLERFRHLGNAVLLGTASFWEGVDVRGEALSCVIIDKLPFASPGDPVLAARIDALRRRGGNPFREFQLPQAVIALKQGAGRLIRDDRDRGVLVVCDPRLLSRSYGWAFLDSLPPMLRSRELEDVRRFFAADAG
ncbi:MAG: ATP-dependent DNA helicase [Candidatus Thiosymbion ectosymbiont of Robbea hypermnestra]|nr:ATP-dependent DNA helicase [Candidatus Thiosymbion ectosymbiont of Robbea hypermnestra]